MQINQPRKSEFIKIASEDDVASKGARYACGIGVEVGLAIAARRKMCQDDLLDLGLGGNFADLLTRQMVGDQMLHQRGQLVRGEAGKGADQPLDPSEIDDLANQIVGAFGQSFEMFGGPGIARSEEHTSELPSLMRISYAVFCLKKKKLQEIENIKKNYTYKKTKKKIQTIHDE